MYTTFTSDRAFGDARSFSKFLLMWYDITTEKPLFLAGSSMKPFCAPVQPTYNPSLNKTFMSCSLQHIRNMAINIALVIILLMHHVLRAIWRSPQVVLGQGGPCHFCVTRMNIPQGWSRFCLFKCSSRQGLLHHTKSWSWLQQPKATSQGNLGLVCYPTLP